jgi:cytochrome c oxidase assembly protein subunit 15
MSLGKYLVYSTILSTFVLIVWGAYLTAGNWGAGCGAGGSVVSSDWPYCNGSLAFPNPAVNYGAFVEYIHRTLSVLVSVILLVTVIAIARMKPRPTTAFRALLLSLFLLIVQVALGAIVIDSSLNAVVTALHLANATALFAVMVVAGVYIHIFDKKPS